MGKKLRTSIAARRAGVMPKTIRRWCDHYGLPYQVTAGGHIRIDEDDLSRFLEQRKKARERRRLGRDADGRSYVGITDEF